jgi:hypothetical protein
VSSVAIYATGEGGNGHNGQSGSNSGGGGGGGAFAGEASVAVTGGVTTLTVTIGGGGTGTDTTVTGGSVTVTAAHGASPGSTSGGAGGAAGSNTIAYRGGTGGSGEAAASKGGGGGGGSAGSGSNGGTGGSVGGTSGGAGGSGGAGTFPGAPGGTGGNDNGTGTGGTAPGGGGGGGGDLSGSHAGGGGAAGQVTIVYTVTTVLSGAAALSGAGTLAASETAFMPSVSLSGSGSSGPGSAYYATYAATYQPAGTEWAFILAASLSGHGTLTAAAAASGGAGAAALSGAGTMAAARLVTWEPAAALSGAGTLAGIPIGEAAAALAGTGTMAALQSAEYYAALTGTGLLTAGTYQLGFAAALSGTGLLSVVRVLGVVTAGASRGAITTPYAWPGSSQVAVSAPGSSRLYWLGTLGQVTALTYSYVCPGGCDSMTCTVMVPASYRTQLFNPGWTVRIFRGGHQVWSGKLDEPIPVAGSGGGWNLTAIGTGNLGQDYLAVYTDTWPTGEPDESINAAIARGLPWVNPGVGTPAGIWLGQAVDSGGQTITALLGLACTRGGLTWYVNSQPGGVIGDDLSVFPLPTTVNRLLVCDTPVPRTLGGDTNVIWIRYQVSADTTTTTGTTTTSTPAVYALTSVQNAQSVAMHGTIETFIDLSDVGVMTQAAAQAVGNSALQLYTRASFAGPFVGHYGDLMNAGGQPIDPGTDQAGNVVRLLLTDFAYGGEVAPGGPIDLIVGSYSWDDFAQAFTLSAMNTLDQSLTGLLSMTNTVLTPIAVAST